MIPKFTTLKGNIIPVAQENVDTDAIIPARFLKETGRKGFGEKLFYDWRYDNTGKKLPSIFNDPFYKKAHILLANTNFGIGSSREHAVWALYDYGIRCIIGSSFGDIFYNNALKNGLLIAKTKKKYIKDLFEKVNKNPRLKVIVNLKKQWIILPDKNVYEFDIDPFRKKCLLMGTDEIEYILSFSDKITRYEKTNRSFTR